MIDTFEPRLAVIVVNWNGTSRSLACLRSIIATGYPGLVPILVDNGSADDPRSRFETELPDVTVLRLDENLGYAAGCNAGARWALDAGAHFLCFLNNDTTVEADVFQELLAAARRHPDAILGPKIVYSRDPAMVWSAGGELSRPWMRNRHIGRDQPVSAHGSSQRVAWTTGCALFVSSATYRRLGPLDEGYFLFLEDIEWCVRGNRRGIETWYVPGAVVRHEVSSSTGSLPADHVFYYGCRNTYRLAFSQQLGRDRLWMSGELARTMAVMALRWVLLPAFRRSPFQRARAHALLDFVRGRRGPARFSPAGRGEPGLTAARSASLRR
jgi:GT2 family glycosyltransferase